jgi:cytochrome c oxidase subunit 2
MPLVSHTAVIISVADLIAVAIGGVISFVVFQSTFRPLEEDGRTTTWSRRETTWLVIVIVALFALLMGTIFYVPYGNSAGPGGQIVRVTGVQFAWAIDAPQGIVTGRPVTFVARSRDVAHGFGVYNPSGVLIFQAQVVPDHDQKIVHTFSQAGVYTVHCLEFCGAGHHKMSTTFVVRKGRA